MNLMVRDKLLGNTFRIAGYVTRDATTIADYKIIWNRPEKVPMTDPRKSGDRTGLHPDVKPTDYCRFYETSEELKNADDIVKKMFSLEFHPRKETVTVKRERIINLVKRHPLDRGSPETTIASMTSEIQQLQEHMMRNPRNRTTKVFLRELIDKRRKSLKMLRIWDYRRFEWMLEKLNLEFRPKPEVPIKASRKETLHLLTDKYCNEIIQAKLDAYKQELMAEQKKFYKEKAETLAFIRNEEIECGVPPTVTEEEIEEARKKYESLMKNEVKKIVK